MESPTVATEAGSSGVIDRESLKAALSREKSAEVTRDGGTFSGRQDLRNGEGVIPPTRQYVETVRSDAG